MIVELGHFALALALMAALIQSTLPVVGSIRRDDRLMALSSSTALTTFLLVGLSYAALTWAYMVSDFSVLNVWENSHSKMPDLYKFTGVWGNHEGSMMLWLLILTFF